jgi:hypothetical protein
MFAKYFIIKIFEILIPSSTINIYYVYIIRTKRVIVMFYLMGIIPVKKFQSFRVLETSTGFKKSPEKKVHQACAMSSSSGLQFPVDLSPMKMSHWTFKCTPIRLNVDFQWNVKPIGNSGKLNKN